MCCWSPRSLGCTARVGRPRNGARTLGRSSLTRGWAFSLQWHFYRQVLGRSLRAFFVFRAFDIVKPPPARQLEALPGGWGIVADDVVAGLYSNLVIRSSFYLVEWVG